MDKFDEERFVRDLGTLLNRIEGRLQWVIVLLGAQLLLAASFWLKH